MSRFDSLPTYHFVDSNNDTLNNPVIPITRNYVIEGNTVTGKNMLDAVEFYSALEKAVEERNGNTLDYSQREEDGRNCVRFIDCWNARYKLLNFKENTQYTVSMDCKTVSRSTANTQGSALFVFYYTDGTYSRVNLSKNQNWVHKTLTSTEGKTISTVGLQSCNWTNWCYVDVDTFQLEEGATATDYEVYQGSYVGDKTKNLLSYPYEGINRNETKILAGASVTDNGDGSITVTNTTTALSELVLKSFDLKDGNFDITQPYTASGGISNLNWIKVVIFAEDDTVIKEWNVTSEPQLINLPTILSGDYAEGKDPKNMQIQLSLGEGGGDVNGETFYPQLELANLIDEETTLSQEGWIKQEDGSWHAATTGVVDSKILWTNIEKYSKTLKVTYKLKYSKSKAETGGLTGLNLRIIYKDGTIDYTSSDISEWQADTWYTLVVNSKQNKVVGYIQWGWRTDISTWVKDIIITKNTPPVEYEPYGYKIPLEIHSTNLITYPYADTTKTVNGITFTDNKDGSITINGTATANVSFEFSSDLLSIMDKSKTYVFSANVVGTSDKYARILLYKGGSSIKEIGLSGNNPSTKVILSSFDCDSVKCQFLVKKGLTLSDYTVRLQLKESKIEEENLVAYPYAYSTTTTNGITFTDNKDGSITINGTATDNAIFYVRTVSKPLVLKKNRVYNLSGGQQNKGVILCLQDNSYKQSMWDGVFVSNYEKYYMFIRVTSGYTIDNMTIIPQLQDCGITADFESDFVSEESNIFLSEPLKKGQIYNCNEKKEKQLNLKVDKTNVISVKTSIKPENVNYQYYIY